MKESDEIFLALLTNDIGMALQAMTKTVGGLFLSPDAIAIYAVFILGFLGFWLKVKIENQNN